MPTANTPTCPSCGYDMTGVPLDEHNKAHSPSAVPMTILHF